MRRILVIGLLFALANSLAVGVSDAREGGGSGLPPDDPQRGLIYKGLRHDPDGPCGQLLQVTTVGTATLCTHGPDPAPPGVDVRSRRPSLAPSDDTARAAQSAVPTAPISCIDDGSSGPRVQAIYAVASDVTDRYDQVVSSIRHWAEQVEGVVQQSAAETGGTRGVRWVTQSTGTGCELVVDHVVIGPTGDDSFTNTINELALRGYIRPDRRYLTWVDANVLCGIGGVVLDDTPDLENGNNGLFPLYARVDSGCWGLLDQFTSGPNYVSVEAHELVHNFGAVQSSAVHSTGGPSGSGSGGHCFDEWDAMCYDDDNNPSTFPLQVICDESHGPLLDCNHDDYFHTSPANGSYLDTHWNSASSIFFTGSPFPTTRSLTVSRSGVGSGRVVGELYGILDAEANCTAAGSTCDWVDEVGDIGIDCGSTCTSILSTNLPVSLVAIPNAGSDFGNWTGSCLAVYERTDAQGNTQTVCDVLMNRVHSINARFATPAPRPDLSIARQGGAYRGDDIYNSTGSGQVQSATVRRGRSASFQIRIANDSSRVDDIVLKGTGSSQDFSVKYFSGSTDITDFMRRGAVNLQDIPPNAFGTLKVVIKVKSSATIGETKTVKIIASSLGNTSLIDVVKAKVKAS